MSDKLTVALKEWDVACRALLSGELAVLVRKGGILESENAFELEHPRFLLFPTWIHQEVRMLKEPWQRGVTQVSAEPARVKLAGWAEAVKIWELGGAGYEGGVAHVEEQLKGIGDLHIWNEAWVKMRAAYRPEKPLYVVVLRAWKLPQVVELANTPAYAGCRSWVPLEEGVDVEGSVPAISEEKLGGIVERVGRALGRE